VAAVTVYNASDDGRKGRPKHVEHMIDKHQHMHFFTFKTVLV